MNKLRIIIKVSALLTIILISSACSRAPQTDKLKISYEKYVMANGLQVILHKTNPICINQRNPQEIFIGI